MRKKYIVYSIGLLLSALPATQSSFADTAAELKHAEGLFKAKQYAQAEPIYRKVLQSDPNNAEAVCQAGKMLARILVATDRLEQVQEAIEQLLTRSANHARLPHALHEILDQAKDSGKTVQVGQVYHAILEERPEQAQAIWLKMSVAIADVHLGNDQAVESTLQNIIDHHQADDRSTEAFGQVAWAYRKLDQQAKARRVYQWVVDNWRARDRTIFSQRGVVLCSIALDDQPAAAAGVQKLLADYADSKYMAEIARSIAVEYYRKGRLDHARELHQYVVDKHPQSPEAIWCQRDIAFCYIDAANAQAAEEALQKLVTSFAANARLPEALADVGEYYRKKKDLANARNVHREVVKRFPNSEEAILSQRNAILANMGLKDDSQVQAGIETLLNQFAKDNDIVPVVGYVADRLGRGKEAEREKLYRRIIDNHAKHEMVVRIKGKLAQIRISLGDDSAAEAIFREITTQHANHPRFAEAASLVAEGYRERAMAVEVQQIKQPGDIPYAVRVATEGRSEIVKGYYRRAIEKWEIVIKELPASTEITPIAYTFAGEAYDRIGDPKKALEYFSIAAEQYPAYQHADYALFMVSRLWGQLQKQELATESQAWPMIVQASQTLLNRYPQSEYARIARKTVDCITATETRRKEQANEQQ